MNGASAALMISEVPLPTPVGAVRIGKIEGNFVVNPPEESLLEDTDLDLVVAGTEDAILMVEAGANEIPEAEILDALDIAHDAIKKLCAAQRELAEKAGKEKLVIEAPQVDADLLAQIQASHGAALDEATQVEDKLARQDATKAVEEDVARAVLRRPRGRHVRRVPRKRAGAFDKLEKQVIRERIAVHKKRPDGRAERGDPPDHDRGGAAAAHARLGALHARPDAGAERRGAGHAQGGDAPRHPRARDQEVLLAPLQLPALQRGRGGLHARPQAA